MRHSAVFALAIPAAVLLAVSSAFAQRTQSAPFALANSTLQDVSDSTLRSVLAGLQDVAALVPRDDRVSVLTQFSAPVVVVPLRKVGDDERSVYLFYVPERKQVFFLSAVKDNGGRPEVRLWGSGAWELVISADRISLLPRPTDQTDPLTDSMLEAAGVMAPPTSPAEVLACIAGVLGIGLDPTSLNSVLTSASCSAVSTVELLLTATNCLSMAGIGANDVFAPIGCLVGMTKLILCGIASCDTPAPSGNVLQNDVPVSGLSGGSGSVQNFSIVVPSGTSSLTVTTSGGSGDADLYVKFGQQPTTSSWTCRPYVGGNAETCTFTNPSAGTWYIMLHGYTPYSGVTLRATFTSSGQPPSGPGVTLLANNTPVSGLAGSQGSEQHFRIDVPSGRQTLTVALSGGTGDADLYVRFGQQATAAAWTCRPYLGGNNETCTISNPSAGSWFVMVRGYQPYAGATLRAWY